MKIVKTLKKKVLMRSSHKLRFKRRKCIHSIEQPSISLDLKYFMIKMKLWYLKSILQFRSSLLPSYCTVFAVWVTLILGYLSESPFIIIFSFSFFYYFWTFAKLWMKRIAHFLFNIVDVISTMQLILIIILIPRRY